MVCCAQFDGEWHRAMVTEIPTTSSKVIIILMYTDLALISLITYYVMYYVQCIHYVHVYIYHTCACTKYTCTLIVLFLQVTVKYIDYGTEEEYEPSRLRKTRNDNPLNSLPPQAIKCKLHGLPTHKVNN